MKLTRQLLLNVEKDARLPELDDLMRTFCSAVRYAFNRLLEKEVKKGDLIKIVNAMFGLNKRYAEDAVMQAEQLILSQEALLPYQIENIEIKIKKTEEKLEDYKTGKKKPKKAPLPLVLAGLEARLKKLRTRLEYLVSCQESGTIPKVIFGGRKNFYQRMKGKISKAEWKDLRSNQLYARGDKSKLGNLNIRIVYEENENAFYLDIANPLASDGSTRKAPRLRFPLYIPDKFFNEVIKVVMPDIAGYTPKKKVMYEYLPYSIEIRRKGGQYYVNMTYEFPTHGVEVKGKEPLETGLTAGIDLNIDRVTVSVVNQQGNLLQHKTFYCHEMEYVSSNRRNNIAGELAKEIIDYLLEENVGGIVLEDITLKQDHDTNKRTNRLLHSFAKKKLHGSLLSRALKNGFKIKKINPAYTSVIARYKYKDMYGMSIHEAASLVIARRGIGLDEKIPTYLLRYVKRIVKTYLETALRSLEELEELSEKQKTRQGTLKRYLSSIKQFKKHHSWKLWNVIHKTLKYNNQGFKLKEV